MVMYIPDEFRYMVMCIHQDIDREASNEEELITVLLEFLNADRKAAVRSFLTDLLSRNPSGEELQEMWHDCEPDWGIGGDENLRHFLATIRDRLTLDAARPA